MKTKRFTLVELLVVLAIVGILIGISLPAFKNLVLGSEFSQSSNLISKTLYLSQNEAIAKRQMVAVVFPQLSSGCIEIIPMYVTKNSGSFIFSSSIQNQKVILLPNTGVVTAIEFLDETNTWQPITTTINNIQWTNYNRTSYSPNEYGIVYKPSRGIRSTDGDYQIRITLSDSVKNGTSTIQKSSHKIYFTINQFTGRVEIIESN